VSGERVQQPAADEQDEPSTAETRLRVLAIVLFWAAGLVLVLAVIGAITVASTDQSLGLFAPEVEKEGRGLVAVASLGAGFTSAGVLAGLGGILTALLNGNARSDR
jgi:hypothetical protein